MFGPSPPKFCDWLASPTQVCSSSWYGGSPAAGGGAFTPGPRPGGTLPPGPPGARGPRPQNWRRGGEGGGGPLGPGDEAGQVVLVLAAKRLGHDRAVQEQRLPVRQRAPDRVRPAAVERLRQLVHDGDQVVARAALEDSEDLVELHGDR